MRRRVQLGMAVEFAGMQVKNLYLACGSMGHFSTMFIENSNAIVAVHIFAVWWYAAFLRDALLARHITRISLVNPSAVDAPLASPGAAGSHSAGGFPAHAEVSGRAVAQATEPIELIIETGPWERRVKLTMRCSSLAESGDCKVQSAQAAGAGDARSEFAAPPEEQASLGELLSAGVLHVDQRSGEVLDESSFNFLMCSDLVVISEEVTTDVQAAMLAYVDTNRLATFLSDGADRESLQQLRSKPAWLRRAFLCSGGRFLDWYGVAALAMGVGSAALWNLPRR